jgi:hypothetical protein
VAGSSLRGLLPPRPAVGGNQRGVRYVVDESFEAVQIEAFSPVAANLARHVELLAGDLVIDPFGGEQYELGTDDLGVGRRVAAGRRKIRQRI